MRIATLPRLWILSLILAGCLNQTTDVEVVFQEMHMGTPFSPRVEVPIPTLGEDPLAFTGVRTRNDTLFLLEARSRDLWVLDLQRSPHVLSLRTRGSDYALPSASALLFWQGSLGFLDRDATFWNLDTAFPTATFPFWADGNPGQAEPGLIREAVVVADSLLVATTVRLRPPAIGTLPGMRIDLLGISDAGGEPVTLATLAEGITGMTRFFALTEGRDSLWVVDPVGKQSMAPLTDSALRWTPRPRLATRPLTAQDQEELAGLQQQIRQRARQLGTNMTHGLLPQEQISLMRGYWQGRTLWAVAQSSPGFTLDGYCEGVYQGTLGARASAIHFAPPYLITVTLTQTLEEDSWLRVYRVADLPEVCPDEG
jgi:hypothetical protein